jgi:hypothetical protein
MPKADVLIERSIGEFGPILLIRLCQIKIALEKFEHLSRHRSLGKPSFRNPHLEEKYSDDLTRWDDEASISTQKARTGARLRRSIVPILGL